MIARRLLQRYEVALRAQPLLTKVRSARRAPTPPARPIHFVRLLHGRRVCRVASQAVSSAVIGGAGDLTCQLVFEAREEVDVWRLCVFTALNGGLVAPTLHRWYSWLHRNVTGEGTRAIGGRLLLDQLVFAPLFIPTFMAALATLEGHPHPLHKAQRQWWPAVVANWQLWVPCQVVNFALVPVHWQVLFANGVACVWNVWVSSISHGGSGHAQPGGAGTAHHEPQLHLSSSHRGADAARTLSTANGTVGP